MNDDKYYEDMLEMQEAEIRAEHMNSWISAGYNPADAVAYASQEMNA